MKKLLFITLVVLSAVMTCQARKTELSLHLKQGQSYKQLTTSNVTINQVIRGQQMNIVMKVKGSMTFKVTAVHPTDYEMDVKYDSLSLSMQMPQRTVEFSSEKSGNPQDVFSSMLGALKNKPFQVVMTKQGKITEVKNLNKVFDSMFDKFPQVPEQQKAQIKAQLLRSYGEDAFKGNVEMTIAIYPDKPVATGDTWVIQNKQKSGMPVNITTTYTYQKNDKNDYLIKGNSKIVTTDTTQYIKNNGMDMKYNMTGTMTSEIKVDKASGWIKEADLQQEMQGTTTIKANARLPQGMMIPMTMKNHMIFTDK